MDNTTVQVKTQHYFSIREYSYHFKVRVGGDAGTEGVTRAAPTVGNESVFGEIVDDKGQSTSQ